MSTGEVIQVIRRMERERGRAAALDCLYDILEDWLFEDRFVEVQHWVESAEIELTSDVILLAILAITLPYKSALPRRAHFAGRVREALKRRHGTANLMAGLD